MVKPYSAPADRLKGVIYRSRTGCKKVETLSATDLFRLITGGISERARDVGETGTSGNGFNLVPRYGRYSVCWRHPL